MKCSGLIFFTLGLAGCGEQNQETKVISTIEREVRLPSGSHPLKAYSRVYAYAPDNRVMAIYLLPEHPNPKLCEEEKEIERKEKSRGGSRFCPPPYGLVAGEQRWIENYRMLPGANDGGCDYIDVEYDLTSKKFLQVACHGRVD
ncbi:hypothetical protein [Sphingobium sp. HWE2-09]|uniref:hypothetical protein n=1 Tax=Sphingobium sp. HWE2-09 TaxID=3108390 RepID=UPI002DCAF4B9|nr:hypothetical protein [Sphingobium sp. HWE2-09]